MHMARRAKMVIGKVKNIGLMVFVFLLIHISNASALTIITRSLGGTPPANTVGAGNLDDIVNAASRIWESAYSDSTVLTLYYGWAPIGTAGNHTLQEIDAEGRETAGMILFDNSGSESFYLDPTPASNEEYLSKREESQDFGSGPVNACRLYFNPIGEAAGHIDLLSVVLHEVGHALGMSGSNPSFVNQSSHGLLYLTENYPFAGAAIPLAYNIYGIVPHFDPLETVYGPLMAGINGDERRMPSELDVLADAQVSKFTLASLDPEKIYHQSVFDTRGRPVPDLIRSRLPIRGTALETSHSSSSTRQR